jgi:ATPase subunit of ABC transporter with duplicated ATPase domains
MPSIPESIMSLLATRALALTLGQPLFTDLNLTLAPADRLGLIAANGSGKSALLSCLAGDLDPTAGEIIRKRGLKCALVPQDLPEALRPLSFRAAVLSALPPDQADYESWRVEIVLDDLIVPQALRDQPLATLSGGWQRSALLARAAITEPDLYLLDEPTNHLDLSRIGALQNWLAALPRDVAVITTSHDRAFLDAVCTRSLFLRPKESRLFALPYSAAKAALTESDAADARRFNNDLAAASQLRRQAAKLKNIGINSGSDLLITKTKQLNARAAQIEASARPAPRELSAGAIRLTNSGSAAKALITLSDARITAPDGRKLFTTGPKWIEAGDRVVVLGRNGAGKSQLLLAVLAAIHGASGAIKATPSLALGACDQDLSHLPPKTTPFALTAQFAPDQTARTLLAGAGLRPDLQSQRIELLSGGQRARLAFLLLRLQEPNFYLLDEPTNHLDIEGQEALEAELCAQGATCLIVSHDRNFVRAIATRHWEISQSRLIECDSPEPFFAAELARAAQTPP